MFLLVEGEYSNFFQVDCTRSFNRERVGFIVNNNLIDTRVTNHTVKWLQNVAIRYPKSPLQAEGK